MSMTDLLQDYHIPFQTEDHKHCRPGWINMACCWCYGNPGLHLGWRISGGYFYCWRCGRKKTISTLSKILSLPYEQTKEIVKQYRIKSGIVTQTVIEVKRKKFKFPNGVGSLLPKHRKYLKNRGFNPDQLIKKWNLLGTGPVGLLDKIDYRFRIIIPIEWGNKVVSFQGRDVTEKHKRKYMACPKVREIKDHKTVLYRPKQLNRDQPIIVVEGVTDVWRLPYQSLGTFGIMHKEAQTAWIANNFKEVIILFDDDPQAVIQSKKLSAELRFRGVYAKSEFIKGDPGSLTDKEASNLIKSFGLQPEEV